jgi:CubicO group peptidase (beta-lactamase class C family)
MLTWFQALNSGKVLSPESTQAIFTSYTTDKGQILEYGYGWEVSELEQLGRLITHNGGGLTGNSILSYYPDLNLTIIILGNRITYQVLGPLPLVIELPADETSREIARGVNSGNFSTMPRMTFFIYPYLGVLIGILVSMIVMIVWLKRR